MTTNVARALVVDDEPVARRMLSFALVQEGFACETAVDGVQASELLAQRKYDLVVTDLRMPNKHGHSLAVDLLNSQDRPTLVIHTSVDDPRMTRDLFARGVDDIVYKPANYATLAARAKILVKGRQAKMPSGSAAPQDACAEAGADPPQHDAQAAPLSTANAALSESRTVDLTSALPISPVALDVYQLAMRDDADVCEIARAIETDAALAAVLLVEGNSACYNPTGEKTFDLQEFVVRIGPRRIGDLALAASARAGLGRNRFRWLDVDLAWKQSMAAGLAMQTLIERGGHQRIEDGLFLSAIFHPLGRIVLASVFGDLHSQLTERCGEQNELLCLAERKAFGRSQTEIISDLLGKWNVPSEITLPLKGSSSSYESLSALSSTEFIRVALVKLSILIGQIAVNRWQNWDLLEFPPAKIITKLGIRSLGEVITATRRGMASKLTSHNGSPETAKDRRSSDVVAWGYHTLSPVGFDFLAAVLPSLGIKAIYDDLESHDRLIVNCLNMEASEAIKILPPPGDRRFVLVAPQHQSSRLNELGQVISFPTSYGAVADVLQHCPPQKCARTT